MACLKTMLALPASIVALEDDLFAMPPLISEVANGVDHIAEAADVGVDVEAKLGRRDAGIEGAARAGVGQGGRRGCA